MICRTCMYAADAVTGSGRKAANLAAAVHAECKGCDCQHDVAKQLEGRTTA